MAVHVFAFAHKLRCGYIDFESKHGSGIYHKNGYCSYPRYLASITCRIYHEKWGKFLLRRGWIGVSFSVRPDEFLRVVHDYACFDRIGIDVCLDMSKRVETPTRVFGDNQRHSI